MTAIPVLWVSYRPEILARGYADQGFLEAALAGELWTPPDAFTFEHHVVTPSDDGGLMDFPDVDGCVFIFNGRTHVDFIDWINETISHFSWVLVMLCGDEEWDFPWQQLKHPNMRLYVMQARPEHAELKRFIPGGWYPQTRDHLSHSFDWNPERPFDWSFIGQITHERRQEFAAVARELLNRGSNGELRETDRYLSDETPRSAYFEIMGESKMVPSPSGPYSVDCARAFEALEAGCVPACDTKTAYAGKFNYWSLLFQTDGYVPFPLISDWSQFPHMLNVVLHDWPASANRCYSFWQQWKRRWVTTLHDDIHQLTDSAWNRTDPNDAITVIVTTSPSPIHPSTAHITQTIDSLRQQLPLAEVIVVCDGVRPEQEHLRAPYEEYVRQLTWLTNFRWRNVVPLVLDTWQHQANATKRAMEHVHTPLIFFMEHDTPITGEIQWEMMVDAITNGDANVIQLHINDYIIPEHQSIMLDDKPQRVRRMWLRRTSAWWQRPHLAHTGFYLNLLNLFTPDSRTMIEDVVYPKMLNEITDDPAAWQNYWQVWVYEPDTPSILRSLHLDGRGDEPKFEMLP